MKKLRDCAACGQPVIARPYQADSARACSPRCAGRLASQVLSHSTIQAIVQADMHRICTVDAHEPACFTKVEEPFDPS
jgi:hypothetical protein